MAGVLQPNVMVVLTGTAAGGFGVVPAGKAESCCLMACLAAGSTADNWINLVMHDPSQSITQDMVLAYQEPVRYRQPGGNPVLLQDFIVPAGCNLYAVASVAGQSVNLLLYNRWRYDA